MSIHVNKDLLVHRVMFEHGVGLILNNLFMSVEVRSGLLSLLFLIWRFFPVSSIHFTMIEEHLSMHVT